MSQDESPTSVNPSTESREMIFQLKHEVARLQSLNQSQRLANQNMEEDLDKAVSDLVEVEESCRELRKKAKQVDDLASSLGTSRALIAELSAENERLRSQAESNINAKCKCADRSVFVAPLNETCLEEANEELACMRNELIEKEEAIFECNERLNDVLEELKTTKEELESLCEENLHLQSENREIKFKYDEASNCVAGLQVAQQNGIVNSNLAECGNNLFGELIEGGKKAENELIQVHCMLTNEKKRNGVLHASIENLKAELQSVVMENEKARLCRVEISRKGNSKETELLRDQNNILKAQLETYKSSTPSTNVLNGDVDFKLAALRKEKIESDRKMFKKMENLGKEMDIITGSNEALKNLAHAQNDILFQNREFCNSERQRVNYKKMVIDLGLEDLKFSFKALDKKENSENNSTKRRIETISETKSRMDALTASILKRPKLKYTSD
uniref:Uncharacterized protein n=1 Tax=Rhabditophanes sp. KR3021 TaxID=114890 RepID=A0AC35UGF9_9BILA